MPDVSLNGIEFVINGSSDEASDSIDKLNEKLNGLKSSLLGVQSVSKFSAAVKSVGDSAKKATNPLNNFLASIKRIAFYRMIRTVIKEIAEAIKEGAQSFYDFTKRVNPQFTNYAKALDSVKAASTQMKNQLGAAFGSLYSAIAPIITALISLVTKLANVLTMLFARLGGSSGWYKATEASADAISDVGGAAKEAMRYLAPFDELNRLPSNNGGGGGGDGGDGGGYEWVSFEQFDIGDGLASIAQWFTDMFNSAAEWIEGVDWINLASTIVTKIGEAFDKVDWAALAQSISRFIGAAIGAVSGFLVGALADLVESICDGIYNAFHNSDGTLKTGEEIWNGIITGIKNAIVNVATWVKDNIVTPFVGGFKRAFGIASPAKEMEEPGEMVGLGILAGIAKPFEAIGNWIEEHILQPIRDFFAGKTSFELPFNLSIPEGFEKRLANIKAAWEKIKSRKPTLTPKFSGWSEAKQKALDKLKNAWAKIITTKSTLTANLQNNVNMDDMDRLKEAWDKIQSVKATFTAKLSAVQAVQKFVTAWNNLGDKALEIKASLADKVKSAWNSMANAWNGNSLLKYLYTMPTLAKGGMLNAGQIFIARESGPEMVGQFGNKTGVLNNQQIVEAVSAGVARAISGLQVTVSTTNPSFASGNETNEETLYRAMLRALNAANREPIEVNLDGQKIYRSVVRMNRMNTAATGVNAMA